MLEALALFGILTAMIAAFLLGERFAMVRGIGTAEQVRAALEKRFDTLLSNWGSERELLRLAGESERNLFRQDLERLQIKNQMILDEAAREREGLLTRIQAWEPAPPAAAPAAPEKPGSHTAELREDALIEAEIKKLEEEGLSPTLDGEGVKDLRSGTMFETVDDAREWRKYCKDNGLPESTKPQQVGGA